MNEQKVYDEKAMESVMESAMELKEKNPDTKLFGEKEHPEETHDSVEKDATEEEAFQLDEDNPLNDMSKQQLTALLKRVKDIAEFAQSQWEASKREFSLKDEYMRALYEFNLKNRDNPPEGKKEDDPEYDRFNGLNKITEKDVVDIFGEEHAIIGITHEVTVDRIKGVMNDFFSWMNVLREYTNVHNAYLELIEFQEEAQIMKLKEIAENETDGEKKAIGLKAVEDYYRIKYLDFLRDELSEDTKNRIIEAFSNEKKVSYWIEKGREKLKQLSLSPKFILEISQFEKRFLDEKYHSQSNILLLYFLNMISYTNLAERKDPARSSIISLVITMDKLIRGLLKPEVKERVLFNVVGLEDQFVGKLPSNKE